MKHTAKKDSRKALAIADNPAESFAGEFEALESRILLSSVSLSGKTSFSYTDSDGDKVSITATNGKLEGLFVGQGSVGEVISLGLTGNTNTMTGTTTPDLSIVVTPNLTKNSVSGVFAGVSSTGTANIAEIYGVMDGLANGVNSIFLSGVIAQDIDFSTAQTGSNAGINTLLVTTGRSFQSDLVNHASLGGIRSLTFADQVDLYDVSAPTIGSLVLVGNFNTATGSTQNLYVNGPLNNFNGTVETTFLGINDGLGIIAPDSAVFGNIIVTGDAVTMTGILNDADINVNFAFSQGLFYIGQGDATLNLLADDRSGGVALGAGSSFVVANGHLNLNVDGILNGTVAAGNGISGLGASTTDALFVQQFGGAGQLLSGNGISDLTIGIGNGNGVIINEDGNVGAITALSGDLGLTVNSDGAIGNLTSSFGDVTGKFTAGTTIGNITAFDDIGGASTFVAEGNIGNIIAGGDVYGTFTSNAGGIGTFTVEGILAPTVTVTGDIQNVSADTIGGNWTSTDGNIGNFKSTDGNLTANLYANNGTIGTLTSINGVIASNVTGTSIGAITSDSGIYGNFQASTGNIGNIVNTDGTINANFYAFAGEIGTVTATNDNGAAISGAADFGATKIGVVTANGDSQVGAIGNGADFFASTSFGGLVITGDKKSDGTFLTSYAQIYGGLTSLGAITAAGNLSTAGSNLSTLTSLTGSINIVNNLLGATPFGGAAGFNGTGQTITIGGAGSNVGGMAAGTANFTVLTTGSIGAISIGGMALAPAMGIVTAANGTINVFSVV